jgi:hypothetical protein
MMLRMREDDSWRTNAAAGEPPHTRTVRVWMRHRQVVNAIFADDF